MYLMAPFPSRVITYSLTMAGKGFGSFHTQDVEILVRQPDHVYTPPSIPFDLPVYNHNGAFGTDIRQHLFLLDDEWVGPSQLNQDRLRMLRI